MFPWRLLICPDVSPASSPQPSSLSGPGRGGDERGLTGLLMSAPAAPSRPNLRLGPLEAHSCPPDSACLATEMRGEDMPQNQEGGFPPHFRTGGDKGEISIQFVGPRPVGDQQSAAPIYGFFLHHWIPCGACEHGGRPISFIFVVNLPKIPCIVSLFEAAWLF